MSDRKTSSKSDSAVMGITDMRPYDRSRELVRAIPLWTEELIDTSPAGRRHVIAQLEAAARAEARRGRSGHWTYDLSRHRQIYRCLECEQAELEAIERKEAA